MRWTANRYNTLLRKGSNRQRYLIYIGCMLLIIFTSAGFSDELNLVTEVEFQPLASATQRLVEALDYLGSPLSEDDLSAIKKALISEDHCGFRTRISCSEYYCSYCCATRRDTES